VVIAKKDSSISSATTEEVVEETLCFGWIDSKGNTVDAERYKLWLAPRRPKSGWSAVNKRRPSA